MFLWVHWHLAVPEHNLLLIYMYTMASLTELVFDDIEELRRLNKSSPVHVKLTEGLMPVNETL